MLLVAWHQVSSMSLSRMSFLSGWLLFTLMIVQMLYAFRKKFSFFSLGTSAGWHQLHIHTGLLTMVLFLIHIGLHAPGGILESTLALLYLAGLGSGVVGLLVSHVLPRQLTINGQDAREYHHARQGILKYWFFLHVPVAASLLFLALVHGLIVSAWSH